MTTLLATSKALSCAFNGMLSNLHRSFPSLLDSKSYSRALTISFIETRTKSARTGSRRRAITPPKQKRLSLKREHVTHTNRFGSAGSIWSKATKRIAERPRSSPSQMGSSRRCDGRAANKAAPHNRRPRFAFDMFRRFNSLICVPPSPSAAAGEPQRWAKDERL